MTTTLDLSQLPPAALFALVVIWIICRVLPDGIGTHAADLPQLEDSRDGSADLESPSTT